MNKSYDYYLSKGYDAKVAEYLSKGRKKLVGVTAGKDYTLLLHYDGEPVRMYNVRPLIKPGTVFGILDDPEKFRKVYIDDEGAVAWDIDSTLDSRIHWNNKIDICPDSLYMDSIPC